MYISRLYLEVRQWPCFKGRAAVEVSHWTRKPFSRQKKENMAQNRRGRNSLPAPL